MLVGRERELGQISELIESARAGRGALAVVEGPSGVGKSALLAYASEEATDRGCCVLRAAGARLEREYTFGVVRQLFAGAVRAAGASRVLAGAARLAGLPLGLAGSEVVSGDGRGVESSAMHGLYWLTMNLADLQAVVLVVDDAHWADAASLRFVLYLARRLEGVPVLALVAAVPVQERGQAEVIAQFGSIRGTVLMRPALLSEPEVGVVIGERGFPAADPTFVSACHGATGGNPFLLGRAGERAGRRRGDGKW